VSGALVAHARHPSTGFAFALAGRAVAWVEGGFLQANMWQLPGWNTFDCAILHGRTRPAPPWAGLQAMITR